MSRVGKDGIATRRFILEDVGGTPLEGRDLQVSPSLAFESSDPACQNQSLQAEGKVERDTEDNGWRQLNSGGAVEYPHLQAVFIVRLFCFCFEHPPVIPFQPIFVSSELFFS